MLFWRNCHHQLYRKCRFQLDRKSPIWQQCTSDEKWSKWWTFRFHRRKSEAIHCSDVIMNTMASQNTGVSSVCSTICSGAAQKKSQSFFRGIHRWRWIPHKKGPVTRKIFHLRMSSCCGFTQSQFCYWYFLNHEQRILSWILSNHNHHW